MFGWIVAAFVVGCGVGAGLVTWNSKSVEKALARQQKAYDARLDKAKQVIRQVREERDTAYRSMDCADAYRRGKGDRAYDTAG